jgi:hypothetical protein
MAGTTTNNGWTYPTSTDLVKDGATAIQTALQGVDTSTGTGLLAWQTWAPTLGGGWANGNGVWSARYVQLGKTVHVAAYFTLGTTTTKGTTLTVSLPVTAANSARQTNGNAYGILGINTYLLVLKNSTTSNIEVGTSVASATYTTFNAVTSTTPATWATSDVLYIGFTYEAA